MSKFYAGLNPLQKCDKVKELQQGGAKVTMIGDSHSDCAALAQADVGIHVGIGDVAAMKSGQVILLKVGNVSQSYYLMNATDIRGKQTN